MYKVETKVLEDTTKVLDKLVEYLIADEKKHYEAEKGRNHIYLELVKAQKLSKLIKENYTKSKPNYSKDENSSN